ncbi:MAG: hypothetical protein ACM3YE_05775 [Bacteroidota bacterium]
MFCLDCGNCRKGESLFYCTAKNEFVVTETEVIKDRATAKWRKGDPDYENHRRQLRKEKIPQNF